MKRAFFLFVVVALGYFATAHAETIPATAGSGAGWEAAGNTPPFGVKTFNAAATIACAAFVGSGGTVLSYTPENAPSLTYPQSMSLSLQCLYRDNSTNTNHYAYASIRSTWENYSCPDASWTLQGTQCFREDCPLGQDRNAAGQCVKDCTGRAGMALPNTHYRVGESGTGSFGGCKFNCSTRVKFAISVTGDIDNMPEGEWISTGCRYTGASGSEGDYNAEGTGTDVPPPDKPTKPDDCMARGMGYVQSSSGQTNCVSSSEAPAGQKPQEVRHDEGSSSGKAGADGTPDKNSGDYKENNKSTSIKNGDVIVKSEERIKQPGYDNGTPQPCPDGYTSDGAGFCSKTTAQKEKETDYCRKNPNEAVCKLTKTGETNDKPKEDAGTCKDGDTSAACAKLDNAPTGEELPTSSIGVSSIGVVSVSSSASCPQGPQMPFGIGYMPLDGICSLASGIRPIILALAWLSAGLIVIGAFRET